jgi:hypothetical protein
MTNRGTRASGFHRGATQRLEVAEIELHNFLRAAVNGGREHVTIVEIG